MSNQITVQQNLSPCFFTFVGGSYNWVGTKDREQIATINSTLKSDSIAVIIFRPFYEAACGNGDNIYFNLLVSSSRFLAPNLKPELDSGVRMDRERMDISH